MNSIASDTYQSNSDHPAQGADRASDSGLVYLSAKDLCARFRCSRRTIFRRMKRKVNPFPAPCIQEFGSFNLWDAKDVGAWEQRERERTTCER
jgi:hypothetical protein